jgi:hypothetical protein
MSVFVMTVIGEGRHDWAGACDELTWAPSGCCWRFVPDGSLATRVRSILRIEPRAVVVRVGMGAAIDQAESLVRRLLMVGLRIVIVVAEEHDEAVESAVRQAGAMYLCGDQAEQELERVLESVVEPRARERPAMQVDSTDAMKLDGS